MELRLRLRLSCLPGGEVSALNPGAALGAAAVRVSPSVSTVTLRSRTAPCWLHVRMTGLILESRKLPPPSR